MTSELFKTIQKKFDLKNKEMADALNVSVKAVEQWRAGTRKIPGPAIVALDLMMKMWARPERWECPHCKEKIA